MGQLSMLWWLRYDKVQTSMVWEWCSWKMGRFRSWPKGYGRSSLIRKGMSQTSNCPCNAVYYAIYQCSWELSGRCYFETKKGVGIKRQLLAVYAKQAFTDSQIFIIFRFFKIQALQNILCSAETLSMLWTIICWCTIVIGAFWHSH